MEEDVFEASESSDSDLEISEGLHRDFEKSSRWGKSLQMLKKMGWKEGEGLGRKQKGMVQIRSGPKNQITKRIEVLNRGASFRWSFGPLSA